MKTQGNTKETQGQTIETNKESTEKQGQLIAKLTIYMLGTVWVRFRPRGLDQKLGKASKSKERKDKQRKPNKNKETQGTIRNQNEK